MTLSEIFAFLDRLDRPVVVALDEFQEVGKYKDVGEEALLRSKLQFSPNVRMMFSGSDEHAMGEIFGSYAGSFYKFAAFLAFRVIDKKVYGEFAKKTKFIEYGESLDWGFDFIYDEFLG